MATKTSLVRAKYALKKAKRELKGKVKERTVQLEEANKQCESWTNELEQLNFEFGMLLQLGDIFQGCATLEEAYAVIRRTLNLLFPSDSGAVFVIDKSGEVLEQIASWGGFNPPAIPADECKSFGLSSANISLETRGNLNCPLADAASICVPLVTLEKTFGVLHLRLSDARETNGQPSETKQRLAMTVAEHISLAVQNLKLRESLREMSIKDPLTGLYNRRHMDASFEMEINRAKRKSFPVSVIMLDIDHFKRINDSYGHEAGDTVLKNLGSFLIKSVRTSDIVCRYGGEEFLMILPETDIDIAFSRAEDIRLTFGKMHIQAGNQIIKDITISAGVSAFPAFGENANTVIAAADAALYKAKESGRDRVLSCRLIFTDYYFAPPLCGCG